MKTITIFLILCVIALFPGLTAMADPGHPDTVRVGTTSVMAGGEVALPVYFYNDETISAVEIVLDYDNNYLDIDSFSIAGSRIAGYENLQVIFRDSANLINLYLYDLYQNIPPGTGTLCSLYFTTSSSAGDMYFDIGNGKWPFGTPPYDDTMTTRFADSIASSFVFPVVVEGQIHVVAPPPSPDSVWVEKVVGSPGNTVAVNIYGFNSQALTRIDLALEYSSNDLAFNDTSFVGTRGSTASNKAIDLRSQLRQILITLVYNEVTPLEPGTGPLAMILFDIEPTAINGIVTIDSTRFLDTQPLEFTLTSAEGGGKFTPYFTFGYVDIKTTTGVDDHYDPLIPNNFALAQNVPNPFNPTTNIRFDLPRQSFVRLEVINVLGQKVKTLVNESLPAGVHTVVFDGKDDNQHQVASGVYFYRIDTEGFSQSRKMILLK